MTTRDLDKKLIKCSRKRVFLSGRYIELYEYDKPYWYNWPPWLRGGALRDATERAASGTPPETSKGRREDNLSRARRRLRRLVCANETAWGQIPKFITYTFAENVTDLKFANARWAEYARALRTVYGIQKYLGVVEFQKRGAIHFHVLHFSLPFIPDIKRKIGTMWGNGFVKVIGIRKVEKVGSYVSKYLRKHTCNERLVGKKAFFTSKGLIQPREFRSEKTIDNFLKNEKIEQRIHKVFKSEAYGSIAYTQYVTN